MLVTVECFVWEGPPPRDPLELGEALEYAGATGIAKAMEKARGILLSRLEFLLPNISSFAVTTGHTLPIRPESLRRPS